MSLAVQDFLSDKDSTSGSQKWFGKEFVAMVLGGAQQLIIPESFSRLLVEELWDTTPSLHIRVLSDSTLV